MAESTKTAVASHPRFALTKFRPTTLPATLVTRSVLHDRLTAGADQRLTVVVGSAGAGKSVLLSSWAATRALARFFTERVFGPDRAAMLTTQLPATAAGHAERRDQQAAAIRRKIARLDTAEAALITELETPADPGDPAAQALRQRIRARFTDLYTQRTTLETELAALQDTPAEHDNDPTLLDELPILGDILTEAPAALTERLLDAFDVQAVYNRDKNQVTIHATLTGATPQAIKDLLTDPRADHNTPLASQPGTTPQDHVGHLTGHTGSSPRASTAQRGVPGGRPPG